MDFGQRPAGTKQSLLDALIVKSYGAGERFKNIPLQEPASRAILASFHND